MKDFFRQCDGFGGCGCMVATMLFSALVATVITCLIFGIRL